MDPRDARTIWLDDGRQRQRGGAAKNARQGKQEGNAAPKRFLRLGVTAASATSGLAIIAPAPAATAAGSATACFFSPLQGAVPTQSHGNGTRYPDSIT